MDYIENPNGITIKQLKQLLKDWPETDENGDDHELWIENTDGSNLSNVAKRVMRLNKGDLIVESDYLEKLSKFTLVSGDERFELRNGQSPRGVRFKNARPKEVIIESKERLNAIGLARYIEYLQELSYALG